MKFRILYPVLLSLTLTALLAAGLAIRPSASALAAPSAATWYVSPAGNDGNTCQTPGAACATIGAAVGKAFSGDTIEIAAGTYAEHDVQIDKVLTLNGAGATATFVDGNTAGRIFNVTTAATLTNLRLQNGRTPAGALFTAAGGAILNTGAGQLTLRNVVLANNRASGSGGAIFNAGQLTLDNTQVVSNTADEAGGGLYNYNQGVLTITQSSIVSNTAGAFESGGGIFAAGARVSVISSTIAGNVGATFGGGLLVFMNGTTTLDNVTLAGNQALNGGAMYAAQGVITLTNTTVSSNNAANNYGGIYLNGTPLNLHLINTTIAYNTRTSAAGNGVNGLTISGGATASLVNTILSNNQDNNCLSATPPTSQGYNLADDFSCQLNQSGDKQGVDAQLGALTNNGGYVATHALLPGSPAIDAGDSARCPATDARTIARPYDGDGNGAAVCDMGAVEARHSILIADSTVLEGDSGSITAVFTVTLAPTGTTPISVTYVTINDTALAGSDYTAISGTLTFNPGELTKTIGVSITGDLNDESNETFRVDLFTLAAVDLLDAQAVGTIIDNDGLSELSIADQTITEGNSGSKSMPFVVTLSPASTSIVTVSYATVAGTATPGSDFTAANNTLVFQPGQISKTISISVLGDTLDEGVSEAFTVQLSNPINATLTDGSATGTITDDDAARVSFASGPTVLEGDSGFTAGTFTVTLTTAANFTITVDYTLSSGVGAGGATVGEDFVPASGTLTFTPGVTLLTFPVNIIGDEQGEADEIFYGNLSNASVPVNGGVDSGLILNDDAFLIYLPLVWR